VARVSWLLTVGLAVALGGAGAIAAGGSARAQPVHLFVSSSALSAPPR